MPDVKTPEPALIPVASFADVPPFQSEEEEHRFWSTHSFGPEILDQMEPVPDDELPPATHGASLLPDVAKASSAESGTSAAAMAITLGIAVLGAVGIGIVIYGLLKGKPSSDMFAPTRVSYLKMAAGGASYVTKAAATGIGALAGLVLGTFLGQLTVRGSCLPGSRGSVCLQARPDQLDARVPGDQPTATAIPGIVTSTDIVWGYVLSSG